MLNKTDCLCLVSVSALSVCIYPSIYPSVCPSIHPSILPSIHSSVYPFIHPSVIYLCFNCFQMMTGYHMANGMTNRSSQMTPNRQSYEVLDIEIDHGCGEAACGTGPVPLYKYHELPSFLRGNPYVVKGYRSLLPFGLCLKRQVLVGLFELVQYSRFCM